MSGQNVRVKIFDPSSNLTFSYLADHTNISEIPNSFSVHKACFIKFVDHAYFSLLKSKPDLKKKSASKQTIQKLECVSPKS
jgi:hypothetical protein